MSVDYSAVIPFQHDVSLFGSVPLILRDGIIVRSIRPEHLGAILKKSRRMSEQISSSTKCIVISTGENKPQAQPIADAALCGTFSLNVFSKSGSVSHGQAFIIKFTRSPLVTEILEYGMQKANKPAKFLIDKKVADPASIKSLFESTEAALRKDSALAIALRRYNTALAREIPEDKIIDLSICLESIFNSQSEISFRFALYNAVLTKKDVEERLQAYKTMKDLYSNRSNLVHGNKLLNREWFDQNWLAVVKTAKLSLLRKIEFLSENGKEDWQPYLDRLVLGGE